MTAWLLQRDHLLDETITDTNFFLTTCVCPQKLFSTKSWCYHVPNASILAPSILEFICSSILQMFVVPGGKRKHIRHLSKLIYYVSCPSEGWKPLLERRSFSVQSSLARMGEAVTYIMDRRHGAVDGQTSTWILAWNPTSFVWWRETGKYIFLRYQSRRLQEMLQKGNPSSKVKAREKRSTEHHRHQEDHYACNLSNNFLFG